MGSIYIGRLFRLKNSDSIKKTGNTPDSMIEAIVRAHLNYGLGDTDKVPVSSGSWTWSGFLS